MASVPHRIGAILNKKFPNNKIAQSHYGELLAEYVASALHPPHLLEELETEDEGKFWSAVWEAMLHRHFVRLGYRIINNSKKAGQNGPDFGFELNGQKIWVEAVVPGPQGIPPEYLEPPGREIRVRTQPDRERVLRCTSAIADKRLKLQEYLDSGIIAPTDATVIAVNICRLSDWDIDGTGISQLPLSLEAVFPVGPLGVAVTAEGILAEHAHHTPRFEVQKASGVQIQTGNFLHPDYSNVSAILQAHQKDLHEKALALSLIHNPLANIALPKGLFASSKEFVAAQDGDIYKLRDMLAGA